MSEATAFGRTDDELAAIPPAYRADAFAGQRVLVSGAGSGIGRAIAHRFAQLGATLMLCGRDAERLEGTRDALVRLYGAKPEIAAMTIRDPAAVAALVARTHETLGGIDVLVNNAGGQFPLPAIDISPNGWKAVIDTNLNGTWYMMQAAAQAWREAGQGGAIVNIVAVVGRGMPGIAHTCAARAGVIHATRTAAVEWAPLGIRANCVAPGIVASEGMAAYAPEVRAAFPKSNLMRRFGRVEEVADAVLYLAGGTGSFITGEVLTIDGGNHLWGDQWAIPRPDFFKTE